MTDRGEESGAWAGLSASHMESLAYARGLLDDEGPDALRAWAETLTDEQVRDLLVTALILYHETRGTLGDND